MPEQKPKEQEFRQMLIQLHDELERARALDDGERAIMRHLMSDIQSALQREEAAHGESLVERLEKSVTVLEVSHPTVAGTIRKALDTLNVAGI